MHSSSGGKTGQPANTSMELDISPLWGYPGVNGLSLAPDRRSITVWVKGAQYVAALPDTFLGLPLRVHSTKGDVSPQRFLGVDQEDPGAVQEAARAIRGSSDTYF